MGSELSLPHFFGYGVKETNKKMQIPVLHEEPEYIRTFMTDDVNKALLEEFDQLARAGLYSAFLHKTILELLHAVQRNGKNILRMQSYDNMLEIKINGAGGTDDKIYSESKLITYLLPRGCTFALVDYCLWVFCSGTTKFTGVTDEDEDNKKSTESGDSLEHSITLYPGFTTKQVQSAIPFEKANGANARVNFFIYNNKLWCFASSKHSPTLFCVHDWDKKSNPKPPDPRHITSKPLAHRRITHHELHIHWIVKAWLLEKSENIPLVQRYVKQNGSLTLLAEAMFTWDHHLVFISVDHLQIYAASCGEGLQQMLGITEFEALCQNLSFGSEDSVFQVCERKEDVWTHNSPLPLMEWVKKQRNASDHLFDTSGQLQTTKSEGVVIYFVDEKVEIIGMAKSKTCTYSAWRKLRAACIATVRDAACRAFKKYETVPSLTDPAVKKILGQVLMWCISKCIKHMKNVSHFAEFKKAAFEEFAGTFAEWWLYYCFIPEFKKLEGRPFGELKSAGLRIAQ